MFTNDLHSHLVPIVKTVSISLAILLRFVWVSGIKNLGLFKSRALTMFLYVQTLGNRSCLGQGCHYWENVG